MKWLEHRCEQFEKAESDGYGVAVDDIYYNDKQQAWSMGNGEYGTYPIYYCPFCGLKLAKAPATVASNEG